VPILFSHLHLNTKVIS